jgi:hypothetical protein
LLVDCNSLDSGLASAYTEDHVSEVNYLPRFRPQLISLEEKTLRVYFSGDIDLLENLDIVYITLLVGVEYFRD